MACTIHHGTLAAVSKSGVPTIVVPVRKDQFDSTRVVTELGDGIGFTKQFQKRPADELGKSIVQVLNDEKIAVQAKVIRAIIVTERSDAVTMI